MTTSVTIRQCNGTQRKTSTYSLQRHSGIEIASRVRRLLFSADVVVGGLEWGSGNSMAKQEDGQEWTETERDGAGWGGVQPRLAALTAGWFFGRLVGLSAAFLAEQRGGLDFDLDSDLDLDLEEYEMG